MTTTRSAKGSTRASNQRLRRRAAADTVVCGVYLRISHDPSGQALGVTRQRPYCLALTKKKGWQVPEWAVYVENDKSAWNGPRPEYDRMLADIEAGHLQAVVAYHPDRLYRRMTDLQRLIDVAERNHIAIDTVTAGDMNLNTPTGRMLARMVGAAASHEVEMKTQRWLDSLQQHRELGHMPGSGPRMFGWARNEQPSAEFKDGEVVPHEAAVIRELADRVIAGATITGLCHALNERGVTTTTGKQWRATSMRKLLRNPRLAGYSVLRGEVVIGKDGRPARGQWDPIVDEQTFEVLSALLSGRSRPRPPRVSLLPGLVRCGLCGTSLVTASRRAGTRIYRCPTGPGQHGCGRVSGDAEPIEAVVETFARRRLSDPKVRRQLEKARRGQQPAAAGDVTRLRARIAELEVELEDPDSRESVTSLRKALTKLRTRLVWAENELIAQVQHMPEIPANLEDAWPTELVLRRRLVELVVGGVVLHPGQGGRFRVERVEVEPTP